MNRKISGIRIGNQNKKHREIRQKSTFESEWKIHQQKFTDSGIIYFPENARGGKEKKWFPEKLFGSIICSGGGEVCLAFRSFLQYGPILSVLICKRVFRVLLYVFRIRESSGRKRTGGMFSDCRRTVSFFMSAPFRGDAYRMPETGRTDVDVSRISRQTRHIEIRSLKKRL